MAAAIFMKPWGMIDVTSRKIPIVLGVKRSKVRVTGAVAAMKCFSLLLVCGKSAFYDNFKSIGIGKRRKGRKLA